LTSGYNNVNAPSKTGDGVGYLYVLNAFTGKVIYKISTNAGSAGTPSGLAQINNYVDNAVVNNTTLKVYGGDVLGNIWRFDVNDTIAPSGREATKIGVAETAGHVVQPITTRPELAELNGKPMVFVGTGRLLGATDVGDATGQSVYGIVDPSIGDPVYADLRASLKPLALTQVGSGTAATRTIACTGTTAQCGSTTGWVVDLPASGERVNIDMKLVLGTLVFASNVPDNSACTTGGYSWLNYLDFATGTAVIGGTSGSVGVFRDGSLAVGLGVWRLPTGGGSGTDPGKFVGTVSGSDGSTTTTPVPVKSPVPDGKRISWREIAQ
jgi:type IV pilus assembly protein PilY1